MKEITIGAASWGFRELALPGQLDLVKGLGLDSLELGIANGENDIQMDEDVSRLEQVKKEYASRGLSLLTAATGNDFTVADEAVVRADVAKVRQAIDICAFLGVKSLRIFAGFSPYQEVEERRFGVMIDALNQVAEYGRKHGVMAAVETHGGVQAYPDGVEHFHSVSTWQGCLERILKETSDSLKFVFDPANLYAIPGTDVQAVLELIGSRIAYVHMKDFVGTAGGHLKPGAVGDEKRDWKGILASALQWSDTYMIEYEEPGNIEEGTRRSKDYLEHVWKEILS